jgi:hypothetical protein
MADDKRGTPSGASKGGSSRRRPAPTIDLSATEVKPAEPAGSEAPKTEASPQRGTARSTVLGSFLKYAGLGASLAGGVAATLAVVWFASYWPTGGSSATALRERIAALEAQVNSVPKPADNPALNGLSERIGKLEQDAAKRLAGSADPTVNERLAAIENSMKTLGIALAALNRRLEDSAAATSSARDRAVAAAKTAETLQTKLDALERAAQVTQDKVTQNAGTDATARRALAAFALREAVTRNAPYAAELAGAKDIGADAKTISSLEPFARSGVPSDATLAKEMSALLPSLVAAAGADASRPGGFFEKLQANAGKLVHIHPIDAPAGDDPSTVLARIEVNVAHNNVAGIDHELANLPAKARALSEPWSQRLAGRNAAIDAARKLAADSAAALGAH